MKVNKQNFLISNFPSLPRSKISFSLTHNRPQITSQFPFFAEPWFRYRTRYMLAWRKLGVATGCVDTADLDEANH